MRQTTDFPVHILSGRKALAARTAPYWRALRVGLRVGYLKQRPDAPGRWVARLALPGNDIRQRALGAADDPPAKADGVEFLSYAQAVDAAQTWASPEAKRARRPAPGARATAPASISAAAPPATIAAALEGYALAKLDSGQKDRASAARTLARRHLAPDTARTRIEDVSEPILRGWLRGLDKTLSQGSMDKISNVLRAALSAAGVPDDVLVGLNAAAIGAARGGREEAVAHNIILAKPIIDAVLAAADQQGEDAGLFFRALWISGARPSQVAAARVRDFYIDDAILVAPRSKKGRTGTRKGAGEPLPLPAGFAARLAARISSLRLKADDLLFSRVERVRDPAAFGKHIETGGRVPWGKKSVERSWNALRAALAGAEIALPAEATAYSLRHGRIVTEIDAGRPLPEIARQCDTSVVMIARHYSRHIARRESALAKVRERLQQEEAQAARTTPRSAPKGAGKIL